MNKTKKKPMILHKQNKCIKNQIENILVLDTLYNILLTMIYMMIYMIYIIRYKRKKNYIIYFDDNKPT